MKEGNRDQGLHILELLEFPNWRKKVLKLSAKDCIVFLA
jgi:hypothetical protein